MGNDLAMRVIVVGLGVQGIKRRAVAGKEVVATVDPVHSEANYKSLADVPLSAYDAALVCTPDQTKIDEFQWYQPYPKTLYKSNEFPARK